MDDQTAKQRLGALLATAGDGQDLADFFYESHPTPEELQAVHDKEGTREVAEKCRTLVEALRVLLDRGQTRYEDETFKPIWQALINDRSATTEAAILPLLQNSLAHIAMECRPLLMKLSAQVKKGEKIVLSKREKLLEYILWIVQGRKDQDNPLETGGREPVEEGTNFSSLLPSTRATRKGGDCACCGKAGSRLPCRRCIHIVKQGQIEHQVFATYYCTLACLVADRERHEPTCHGLRALSRIATLFTTLSILTLHHCHEKVLVGISGRGSLITATYGTLTERCYLGSQLFADFPYDGMLASGEISLSVLTHGHSREVFITGRLLFEVLIRVRFWRVEEIVIQPKNMHKTVSHVENGREEFSAFYPHNPLRITLPNGLQFAFDPTASQYGWMETLAPWDEYLKYRAHHGVYDAMDMEPISVSLQEIEALARSGPSLSSSSPLRHVVRVIRRGMMHKATGHLVLVGNGCLLQRPENPIDAVPMMLITMSEEGFEHFAKILYHRTECAIIDALKKFYLDQIMRMYLDFDMQPRLSQRESTTQQLQKVWFSPQEYESYKSDESKQRAYLRRLRKAFKTRQIGG